MKRFTFVYSVLIAGCGAFASFDNQGYGIGINTTEISKGYFSSRYVRFYPSNRMACVGMDWARPLILGSLALAPSAGIEGLRRDRNGSSSWYGIGGLFGIEIFPSRMLVKSLGGKGRRISVDLPQTL